MSPQNLIDYSKASDREILVALIERQDNTNEKIDDFTIRFKEKDEADKEILVDLAIVKTKVMLYGMLGGGVVTIASYVLDKILF